SDHRADRRQRNVRPVGYGTILQCAARPKPAAAGCRQRRHVARAEAADAFEGTKETKGPRVVVCLIVFLASRWHRVRTPLVPALEPLVAHIQARLQQYITPRKLGYVWSRIEVVLDRREGVVLQPDITFVIEGRESIFTDRVWAPPDMVLEVASASAHTGKPEGRVALCSAYGVRE